MEESIVTVVDKRRTSEYQIREHHFLTFLSTSSRLTLTVKMYEYQQGNNKGTLTCFQMIVHMI